MSMMTFVDQNNPTLAIRMGLLKRQGSPVIELRHETWNQDTMRYQITFRGFYENKETLRNIVQARLKFIETFLPNLRLLQND